MGTKSGGFQPIWRRIAAFLLVASLGLSTFACAKPTEPQGLMDQPSAQPNRLTGQLEEVSPPEAIQTLKDLIDAYDPQVRILSPRPGEVLETTTASIRFQVRGLPLFKNEALQLGPHLHVFLDDQPYQAVYDLSEPLVFEDLAPGTHTLRVFASRPWHESFKNVGAFDQRTFHVFAPTPQKALDTQQPLLTYSRPQGSYGAEPIMLDFYLTNAPLHMIAQEDSQDDIPDWRVRCTVNGQSFVFDQWQPIYLKGFKPGQNWVQLELIDEAGKPIENTFNNTVRVIDYQPGGNDTLSQLVRGELTAKEVLGLIDPTYVPPALEAPPEEATTEPTEPTVEEAPETATPAPPEAAPAEATEPELPATEAPAPEPAESEPPEATEPTPSTSPVPAPAGEPETVMPEPKGEPSEAAQPADEVAPETLEPTEMESTETEPAAPAQAPQPPAEKPGRSAPFSFRKSKPVTPVQPPLEKTPIPEFAPELEAPAVEEPPTPPTEPLPLLPELMPDRSQPIPPEPDMPETTAIPSEAAETPSNPLEQPVDSDSGGLSTPEESTPTQPTEPAPDTVSGFKQRFQQWQQRYRERTQIPSAEPEPFVPSPKADAAAETPDFDQMPDAPATSQPNVLEPRTTEPTFDRPPDQPVEDLDPEAPVEPSPDPDAGSAAEPVPTPDIQKFI